MAFLFRAAALCAAVMGLAACASLPRERGDSETRDLIASRRPLPPNWSPLSLEPRPPIPTEALEVEQAVQLAFFYNPQIREQFARLGIGRADLEDARRIANPSLGYVRLAPSAGDSRQVTRSLTFGLTELLLLPVRKRLASGELERIESDVANSALSLATAVEIAWFEAVSAQQVAAMRSLVARAAEGSAKLAQRYFDAGNISALQLAQEQAAATEARIDAVTADTAALRARHALAGLVGLRAEQGWIIPTELPAPKKDAYAPETLTTLALSSRLDLKSAQQVVALREQALSASRRWRWLGGVEVGYEREREFDGARTRGPVASLALPIFNQGQGAIGRADAALVQARADLDATVLSVQNDVRLGWESLTVNRKIAERWRDDLVPNRETIVAQTQARVNFMLVGVFELLLAKQQSYDAYQAYLESVRDYWVARANLRGTVGGRLPDDGTVTEPTLGVQVLLPAEAVGISDPVSSPRAPAPDPHAGHRMPDQASMADPHAGHQKSGQAPMVNPHAGHQMSGMPMSDPPAREPVTERSPPAVEMPKPEPQAHDHQPAMAAPAESDPTAPAPMSPDEPLVEDPESDSHQPHSHGDRP